MVTITAVIAIFVMGTVVVVVVVRAMVTGAMVTGAMVTGAMVTVEDALARVARIKIVFNWRCSCSCLH